MMPAKFDRADAALDKVRELRVHAVVDFILKTRRARSAGKCIRNGFVEDQTTS